MYRQTWEAFNDELVKLAATRQVKEMRRLYEAGDHEGVQQLAGKLYGAGVQKDSPGGVQATRRIKALGRGNEGAAYPVFGPRGVEVRKQYDPASKLWSPGLREDKAKLLEGARGDPRVAQLYSAHEGPNNLAVHRMEHVPGRDVGDEARPINRGERNIHAERSERMYGQAASTPHLEAPARELAGRRRVMEGGLDEVKHSLDSAAGRSGVAGHHDVVWAGDKGERKFNYGNTKIQPDGTYKAIDVLPRGPAPDLRAQAPLTPGHQRPFDFLDKYYPQGVPRAHADTPDAVLASKLGPGSRQPSKRSAATLQRLNVPAPAAMATEMAAPSLGATAVHPRMLSSHGSAGPTPALGRTSVAPEAVLTHITSAPPAAGETAVSSVTRASPETARAARPGPAGPVQAPVTGATAVSPAMRTPVPRPENWAGAPTTSAPAARPAPAAETWARAPVTQAPAPATQPAPRAAAAEQWSGAPVTRRPQVQPRPQITAAEHWGRAPAGAAPQVTAQVAAGVPHPTPSVANAAASALHAPAPAVRAAEGVAGAAAHVGGGLLSGLKRAAPVVAGGAALLGAGALAHRAWKTRQQPQSPPMT